MLNDRQNRLINILKEREKNGLQGKNFQIY